MARWITVGADVATILLLVVAVAVLGARYFESSGEVEPGGYLGDSAGIDWSESDRTLVMALESTCPFCQRSVPFYRRLIAEAGNDVRIVAVAPPEDVGFKDFLTSGGLVPHVIAFVPRGVLPVSGTPTLLLVDDGGQVTHTWIGMLDATREDEVVAELQA